jgi:hypothetical protein
MHVCMRAALRSIQVSIQDRRAKHARGSFSLSRQSGQHKFNNGRGDRSHIVIVLTIILISLMLEFHSASRLLTEFPFHSRSRIDALGSLSHYLEAIVCTAK